MIKRTLYFGNPAYLSLSQGQLLVRLPEVEKNDSLPSAFKKEVMASIPIEDIGIMVLDHKQLTITQALLEELLKHNAVVMTCNSTHHPVGLLLPLEGNAIQSERFRAQIDASEPLKKQLWAQTVTRKIKNQHALLTRAGDSHNYLIPLYQNIKSGDTDNAEAAAASYYWSRIFSFLPNFRRHREGLPPNNLLNYGYAILRATMARSIVAAGLLPTLGIFHRNRYNAYFLADDLMEPYRPIVDQIVLHHISNNGVPEALNKDVKSLFLKIPVIDVMLDGEKSPLMVATQRTAVSLVKCFNGEQRKLLYPTLI